MRNTIIHATMICATSFAVGCVELDETEPVEEDRSELADSTLDDTTVLDDQPEVASGDEPELPPGCQAYATVPTFENYSVEGGGSWYGCPATSRFTVKLKRHRTWWPDATHGTLSGSGSSNWLRIFKSCYRGGPSTMYSEITHDNTGWKRVSAKVNVPCSF